MHSRGYFKYINASIVLIDLVTIFAITKCVQKFPSIPYFDFENLYTSDFLLSWGLSFYLFQSAFSNRIISLNKIGQLHFYQCVTSVSIYFFIQSFNNSGQDHSVHSLEIFGLIFLVLSALRLVEFLLLKSYRSSGKNFVRVAFYKGNGAIEKLNKFMMQNPQFGFRVLGVFNAEHSTIGINDLGDFMKLTKSDEQALQIDELYCALNLSDIHELSALQQICSDRFIKLRIVPEFSGVLERKLDFEYFNNVLVIKLRQEPLENIGARFTKRLFDLIFSTIALAVLVPLVFPIIAIAIKLSTKGPIFFKQLRTGMNEKNFICFKFRTMEFFNAHPEIQATSSDTRVTKVGQFLRKTSLDELPQFINVLLGQMSVVGPRPHMIEHTESYRNQLEHFMFRHSVRPGITGWAQINGLRGNTANIEQMKKRVEFDACYIENYSMYTDLKIIFRTVLLLFKGDKNAY